MKAIVCLRSRLDNNSMGTLLSPHWAIGSTIVNHLSQATGMLLVTSNHHLLEQQPQRLSYRAPMHDNSMDERVYGHYYLTLLLTIYPHINVMKCAPNSQQLHARN